MSNYMKRLFAATIIVFLISPMSALAEYPEKPITLVVGFGIGGSADRMTRSMSSFLADALGVPVKVVNKKGAGTQIAADYILNAKHDGYTIFASTFAPYLANTIISGNAKYVINDFAFINGQWFDFDLFAANKDKPYKTLPQLLKAIKEKPKTISASVVQGSAGHVMLNLVLKANNIPLENLNLVTYNSGGKARHAVAGGNVDFIVISAEGSENIREFLTPLAVVLEQPSKKWDAPTINEALRPLGKSVPVLSGSIRGFATSMAFKKKHPKRFDKLVMVFKSTLEDKGVKKFLTRSNIGSDWIGPEKTQALLEQNYKDFSQYKVTK